MKAQETQHTPGPWAIGQEYGNQRDEIESALGNCVAVVWTRRGPELATARCCYKPDPELMANAHLISAAPELLEACEDAAAIMEDMLSEFSGCSEVIAKVKAAIAKATGKDQ